MLYWPPPYTLCPNSKVRNVSLKICHRYGLRIIVPKNFDVREIIFILQAHRPWIEKAFQKIKPISQESLPDQIHLLAVGQIWKIDYQNSPIEGIRLKETNNFELLLRGQVQDLDKVKKILKGWLLRKGKEYLYPWIEKLSIKTSIDYNDISIRHAKTRWGSCSYEKKISLNYCLLFLRPDLVEYVILHELCHTIHFDHSKKFWALLSTLINNCHHLKKELKNIDNLLPKWL